MRLPCVPFQARQEVFPEEVRVPTLPKECVLCVFPEQVVVSERRSFPTSLYPLLFEFAKSLCNARVLSSLLRSLWQVVRRDHLVVHLLFVPDAHGPVVTSRGREYPQWDAQWAAVWSPPLSFSRQLGEPPGFSMHCMFSLDVRRETPRRFRILVRGRRSAFDTRPCTSVRCAAHFVQRCGILREY